MPADRSRPLSRRAVLVGGGSLTLLAACGKDSTTSRAGDSDRSQGPRPTASDGSRFSLVAFFGNDALRAGIPQRVTFGLGDAQGALVADGPESLDAEVRLAGATIARVRAPKRRNGLSRGYYPITFTPPKAGVYDVRTTAEGEKVEASFQVGTSVPFPQAGERMIAVDTPTSADHRGVEPICTREPPCPLHEVNLRDALGSGKPVAMLIATPALCQTEICGPELDLFLTQQAEFGSRVTMIHVEVYADAKVAADDFSKATLAPAVQAYQLPFEPVLFVSRPDGTVATRLDTIFDTDEIRTALQSGLG